MKNKRALALLRVKKASQSFASQGEIKSKTFSAAACTSRKIHFALQVCKLSANGGQRSARRRVQPFQKSGIAAFLTVSRAIALITALLLALSLFGCARPVQAVPTTEEKAHDTSYETVQSGESAQTRPETGTQDTPADQAQAQTQTTDGNHPMLWEVRAKNGAGHLYLFGSIHVAEPSLYPLPETVEKAYEGCSSLAVEFDTTGIQEDMGIQMQMLSSMLFTDGRDIHDVLDDELYAEVKSFLTENGVPYSPMYDVYNASFWNSLIDEVFLGKCGLNADHGVDAYFLEKAHAEGREILEVESLGFQMDLLSSVPDELMSVMIEGAVSQTQEEYNEAIEELYSAYSSGDEKKLEELVYISADESELEDLGPAERTLLLSQIDDYNKSMLTDRNAGMAKAAERYLESGKSVFFVVGAGHMVGESGIPKLLANDGYEVNRITY